MTTDDKSVAPKGKPKGKQSLQYTTLDGQDVRASQTQADDFELAELWPELERVATDDLFGEAFFVCDARMLGVGSKKGAYYVAMIATGDEDTGFTYRSTVLGGRAVLRTMREIFAHDAEGERDDSKTPSFPKRVKLVEVQGEDFPYFRLVPPTWEPEEGGPAVLRGATQPA